MTLLTVRNEREYDRAIKRLNALLDQVGNNSRHPLTDWRRHPQLSHG